MVFLWFSLGCRYTLFRTDSSGLVLYGSLLVADTVLLRNDCSSVVLHGSPLVADTRCLELNLVVWFYIVLS